MSIRESLKPPVSRNPSDAFPDTAKHFRPRFRSCSGGDMGDCNNCSGGSNDDDSKGGGKRMPIQENRSASR